MKAIIHIGAPKTGSTSIQRFLFLNQKALKRQGFLHKRNVAKRASQFEYPLAALGRVGRLPGGQDQRLRYNARSVEDINAQVKPHVEALKKYARFKDCHTAIFSTEHAAPWLRSPKLVRAFDAMFAEHFGSRLYVLYVRNTVDLLPSTYSEVLKRGRSVTMEEWIRLRMAKKTHYDIAQLWRDTLGSENFSIRLLDPGFLEGGDLYQDFAKVCGFDIEGMEIPPRANESLSAPAAEALRILNGRLPALREDGSQNPLRVGIVPKLMELSADAPRLTLNAEQLAAVDAEWGSSNEKLRAEFFPERDVLFTPRDRAAGNTDTATLREQALELLSDLLVSFRKR